LKTFKTGGIQKSFSLQYAPILKQCISENYRKSGF
jgi:hypothetical protein